jgi:inorganic triphosphatase YgiF
VTTLQPFDITAPDLPTGTVEIAFDQGVLTAGDRSRPVSEIELELKSGCAGTIY